MLNRFHFKRKKTPSAQDETFPFFKLPQELRDRIYDLTLSYDGVQQRITSLPFAQCIKDCKIPYSLGDVTIHVLKSMKRTKRNSQARDHATPSILLVCRAITSEALLCLRKKPLVLSMPPQPCPYHNNEYGTPRIMKAFISKNTLRSIARIHFDMPVACPSHLCPTLGTTSARESLLAWILMILNICQILSKSTAIEELCFQYKHCKEDPFSYLGDSLRGGRFVLATQFKIQKFIDDLPAKAVSLKGQPSLLPASKKLSAALREWSDYISPSLI